MRWLCLTLFIINFNFAAQAKEVNFTLRTQARIKEASC